ncbi:MAG: hypothetical protein ABIT68_00625 [Sphingomicrobium sp.]
MQFLKNLFWVLLAVLIALFASRNWSDVTLNLWGDIQVDIKLPLLMTLMFLLGFVPVFLVHRTRLWTIKRRQEVDQRQQLLAAQQTSSDDIAPVA